MFPNIYVVLFILSETVGFPDSLGRQFGRKLLENSRGRFVYI